MQLFRQLVDVYDTLSRADSCDRLIPLYHSLNKANVTVTIDAAGNFVNAVMLAKEDDRVTLIPGTCASLCRSSDATPRALADKLSYLAGDYDDFLPDAFKGIYQKRHADYMNQLKDWSESECGIPQVSAVYQYLAKNTLLHDLATCGLLGNSDCSYETAKQGYADFCAEKGTIKKNAKKTNSPIDNLLVRWVVLQDKEGEWEEETWKDREVAGSWIAYAHEQTYASSLRGYDCILGENDVPLMKKWYPYVVSSECSASLVSSNRDASQYGFGPYTSASQQATFGLESADKAARALRYLFDTQGKLYGYGSSCQGGIVLWTDSNVTPALPIPDTIANLLPNQKDDEDSLIGADYSKRLLDALSGVRKMMHENQAKNVFMAEVIVANKGRASLTNCASIATEDYCHHVNRWYEDSQWLQTYKSANEGGAYPVIGTPSFMVIARYATLAPGRCLETDRVDNNKCTYSIYSSLVKSMIYGRRIPFTLVNTMANLAAKPLNRKEKDCGSWYVTKRLGIVCSVLSAYYNFDPDMMDRDSNRKKVTYMVDKTLTDRDYLYGRAWGCVQYIANGYTAKRLLKNHAQNGNRYDNFASDAIQRFCSNPGMTLARAMEKIQAVILPSYPNFKPQVEELYSIVDAIGMEEEDKRLGYKWVLGYSAEMNALDAESKARIAEAAKKKAELETA